jgi:hypothetical protein
MMARILFVGALLISLPARALACAICFGDPNSLQVQGAEAGVLFLLGVIITVLLGIAGMILFWARRAKRIGQGTNTITMPTPL